MNTFTIWSQPPVDPNAPTARDWVHRELADPIYHQGQPLLNRLRDWLQEQWNQIPDGAFSSFYGTGAIILAVAIVVIIIGSFLIFGPVRRTYAKRSARAVLSADDTRSAAQIRLDAQQAANAEDWSAATADWFRACVRGMEERTILEERPGRTADETVTAAGLRLPELALLLATAARRFDDVVYGRLTATSQDVKAMQQLDKQVSQTRPAQVNA